MLYYSLDSEEILFEGEALEVMALYGVLRLHEYEEIELELESLSLISDVDPQTTLAFLANELGELGIELQCNAWAGQYEDMIYYHPPTYTEEDALYPVEADEGRTAHYVPTFEDYYVGYQLELI
jgi:hypothetical protein